MSMFNRFKSAVRPLGVAVAVALAAAPVAQATPFSEFLTFDGPQHTNPIFPLPGGGEDKLQDDSLSYNVNQDNSNLGVPYLKTLTLGDTIWGIVTLSDILASGRPNAGVGADSYITILYSATVTGYDALNPGGPLITLGATPTDGVNDLAALCGALCAGAGLQSTTIGVVLSTTNTNGGNPGDPNDPLNWSTSNMTTNFNTLANAWQWEATFGLSADGSNSSFFQAVDGGTLGSTERGAFQFTSQAFALNQWAPVDVADFGGVVHTNDVTLDIGSVKFAGDPLSVPPTAAARGWDYTDQTTFYVNPIPEPGSLALMGIALAGLAGVLRTRRNPK